MLLFLGGVLDRPRAQKAHVRRGGGDDGGAHTHFAGDAEDIGRYLHFRIVGLAHGRDDVVLIMRGCFDGVANFGKVPARRLRQQLRVEHQSGDEGLGALIPKRITTKILALRTEFGDDRRVICGERTVFANEVERIEPVGLAGTGDAEWVKQRDAMPERAPARSGHCIVFAFGIDDDGGAVPT